jgi:hypothetical protein
MPNFRRALRADAILGLEQLTSSQEDNWWKELLRRWTPSGCGEGLRLAVRYNTLDFYFRGHCVAHVGFPLGKHGRPASPQMSCHVRYVFEERISGQQQASYDAKEGMWRHKEFAQARSLDEILKYIEDCKRVSIGMGTRPKISEKTGVDAIVANNKNVIDLEMALPAWKHKKSALRMDIVSLERVENQIQVAFWEAKTFDDARLRSRSETKKPEVIVQLLGDDERKGGDGRKGYVDYLNYGDHEVSVRDGYAQTCSILKQLHNMKIGVTSRGNVTSSLHPLVVEVAQLAGLPEGTISKHLVVKRQPGLVVYSDERKMIKEDIYWPKHECAIKKAGINLLIEQTPEEIILPDRAGAMR